MLDSYKRIREKAIKETKEKVRKEFFRRDNLIVQAVRTMDVIDRTSNLLLEQVRDWYSIYYPELAFETPDGYLENVVELKKEESLGADFGKQDLERIKEFAEAVRKLRNERKEIEKYLEVLMEKETPNIKAVIGPIIGARLIAIAGSLKKLSEFPSSTVQILGAEKALFAHLKKGVKPPKHGMILAYPKIKSAPKKLRGRIARKVASKISIAAKVDYFKGDFIGDRLGNELENEIEKVLRLNK